MRAALAKSPRLAIAGAILAALGASVCCVVPLMLVLLGISGAWIVNLTALDAWRPWFSAVTLLCLALAFLALYSPRARCRTEGECVDPQVLRRRRRLLWLATLMVAVLLLFPYYVGWFLGGGG